MIETKIDKNRMIIHENENYEQEAKIAIDFIIRWGCVAAMPDGEDSSGRQKLRLMTTRELVVRATKTAQLLMAHFRKNNLIHINSGIPTEL